MKLSAEGPVCIANINAVTPSCVRKNVNVLIRDGKIEKISHDPIGESVISLNGRDKFLFPGIVDLHCDTLEKYLEPRPGAYFPIELAISEYDKMIASCGVTTMFHCIVFENFYKSLLKLRDNDNALRIINCLIDLRNQLRVNFKIHVRLDIFNIEAFPIMAELLNSGKADLLSFINHIPGQGQFRDIEKFRKRMTKGYGQDPEAIDKLINERTEYTKNFNENSLIELAQICKDSQIPVASHDDDSAEKVVWSHSVGCSISEFPITLEVAEKARQLGMYTVMGAPNIVMGGSQSGNVAAGELIEKDCCDVLCSDYSPISMLHAVFHLVNNNMLDWHKAVNLISLNPAKALGIDGKTGSIETGKDADLLIIDNDYAVPRIRKVYRRGTEIYSSN